MSDRQPRYKTPTEHTRSPKGSSNPSTPSIVSGSRWGESRTLAAKAGAEESIGPGNGNGNQGTGKLMAPLKAFVGAAAKIAEEEASQRRWLARLEAGRAALRERYLGEDRTRGLTGLNEEATQCSISELSQLMEGVCLEDEGLAESESPDEEGKGKKKDEDWVVVKEDFDVLVFLDDG
ncbi:hypothetical protein M440DRAFT_1460697 [Trichoderma longibrachiatum ATCC 18648]|uniref:Uncharacterized protein n=1 Tax=Trichoderma longibrachiatum ATCC 18648 TaxID=983965 RepID=A0A2T4CBV2_TRILO|nr:hypothetical protein M440DRAFT_1460697 [Trichoderma longibrachiatum ATCC 18648]